MQENMVALENLAPSENSAPPPQILKSRYQERKILGNFYLQIAKKKNN